MRCSVQEYILVGVLSRSTLQAKISQLEAAPTPRSSLCSDAPTLPTQAAEASTLGATAPVATLGSQDLLWHAFSNEASPSPSGPSHIVLEVSPNLNDKFFQNATDPSISWSR
jgi:hypothetical protein